MAGILVFKKHLNIEDTKAGRSPGKIPIKKGHEVAE
jgi:hypothetical protein